MILKLYKLLPHPTARRRAHPEPWFFTMKYVITFYILETKHCLICIFLCSIKPQLTKTCTKTLLTFNSVKVQTCNALTCSILSSSIDRSKPRALWEIKATIHPPLLWNSHWIRDVICVLADTHGTAINQYWLNLILENHSNSNIFFILYSKSKEFITNRR